MVKKAGYVYIENVFGWGKLRSSCNEGEGVFSKGIQAENCVIGKAVYEEVKGKDSHDGQMVWCKGIMQKWCKAILEKKSSNEVECRVQVEVVGKEEEDAGFQ